MGGSRGPHEGPTVGDYTTVDHRSGGLQRNPESKNHLKTREKSNKTWFSQENDGQMSRQSSVYSITSEQNLDSICYELCSIRYFGGFALIFCLIVLISRNLVDILKMTCMYQMMSFKFSF